MRNGIEGEFNSVSGFLFDFFFKETNKIPNSLRKSVLTFLRPWGLFFGSIRLHLVDESDTLLYSKLGASLLLS